MSEVSLQVGGRAYRVACAPGEEERVARLGEIINDKLASMGRLGSQDAQNLLFASLLLADEVLEARETVDAARQTAEAASDRIAAAEDARAKAESNVAELKAHVTQAREQARAAQGQADEATRARDALAGQVSAHEEEIARLQAAHQGASDEVERVSARVTELLQTLAARDENAAHLQDRIETLTREAAAAPTPGAHEAGPSEADLAPALERLAEMLEQTADKLESSRQAS